MEEGERVTLASFEGDGDGGGNKLIPSTHAQLKGFPSFL